MAKQHPKKSNSKQVVKDADKSHSRVWIALPLSDVTGDVLSEVTSYLIEQFGGCIYPKRARQSKLIGVWNYKGQPWVDDNVGIIISDVEKQDEFYAVLDHLKSVIEATEKSAWITHFDIELYDPSLSDDFLAICDELDQLKSRVNKAKAVGDAERFKSDNFNFRIDIVRVRNELRKQRPNVEVIRERWTRIKRSSKRYDVQRKVDSIDPRLRKAIDKIKQSPFQELSG